ncbi:Transcriptional regulatory protein HprR [Gammaproteobacteria bacterium]|nr:Transcriptional regulatory protein HprR [Gammaproteobacteria bacterium]
MSLPILVVEDDPDGRELVGRMLRYHRLSVQTVDDAEEALVQLAQNDYAGVIIDLALPGMDGWTLLKHIQQDPRTSHLRCVAVTAYHSVETAVKAIEDGFVAYFPKPLETTAFVRELERVFA